MIDIDDNDSVHHPYEGCKVVNIPKAMNDHDDSTDSDNNIHDDNTDYHDIFHTHGLSFASTAFFDCWQWNSRIYFFFYSVYNVRTVFIFIYSNFSIWGNHSHLLHLVVFGHMWRLQEPDNGPLTPSVQTPYVM